MTPCPSTPTAPPPRPTPRTPHRGCGGPPPLPQTPTPTGSRSRTSLSSQRRAEAYACPFLLASDPLAFFRSKRLLRGRAEPSPQGIYLHQRGNYRGSVLLLLGRREEHQG